MRWRRVLVPNPVSGQDEVCQQNRMAQPDQLQTGSQQFMLSRQRFTCIQTVEREGYKAWVVYCRGKWRW